MCHQASVFLPWKASLSDTDEGSNTSDMADDAAGKISVYTCQLHYQVPRQTRGWQADMEIGTLCLLTVLSRTGRRNLGAPMGSRPSIALNFQHAQVPLQGL